MLVLAAPDCRQQCGQQARRLTVDGVLDLRQAGYNPAATPPSVVAARSPKLRAVQALTERLPTHMVRWR